MATTDISGGSSARLTNEQRMIRDLARDFTRDEVTPLANRLDPERGEFPDELIEKMGARRSQPVGATAMDIAVEARLGWVGRVG